MNADAIAAAATPISGSYPDKVANGPPSAATYKTIQVAEIAICCEVCTLPEALQKQNAKDQWNSQERPEQNLKEGRIAFPKFEGEWIKR